MPLTNQHPEEEVNQLFSRVAGKYDLMNNVISLGTQRAWRRAFFTQLDVAGGADCLDLCCGTGDLTIELAKRAGRTGRVIGLDFNQAMLDLAEKKVRDLDLQKDIELVKADAMHLPFADNSFDVVTIGFGLRNVPDANQVLAEVTRVLKPGGVFGCLEMSQPNNSLVRVGWKGYFKLFPLMAKAFGGNYRDYRYLQQTSRAFVSAEKLKQMMEEAGMSSVTVTKLNFGAGAIHIGQKKR
ncbi:bifunctional demethylmenaquinone methyltransferase/2-methoxy-6-polyprenyl-1,4-benzoquinol methylase UbiE [Limosilactobacillus fermentum]|uniref:bifunctional demethylmenaquinone methyltransferase/2-methoxy-6-polyprenyl-1,4-benzoquinol methylase UbiE n=1 Tax=Limosilactobacillus fermentum TaxID=1613 RepID=UPI002165A827|nr:bifunctional demethylmenaquinone methyltransferase/2-methoxy-6-polyprenyl-1,4-benzoquinol methylase UbiE [Limosilactobacillus fermentum]MCT2918631.1 bifunctional demethylmenaquinone methyltransferase/2-methoxy-6-polyprenyl-1,4-benzoquinol methylase UbiE [Limosilactobacillus fermentum]UVW03885.1 bifunctional demethylmenaquinone methyltransferase/2-methoxy-6-polyprenyl-1,4-benzoquinol methylase UbiE [Limosilactobacillus fermentum]WEN06353.1 bifunctional demethylmenaquinone methyltransferase/2-m